MARRGTKAKINLGELEKLCAMQATDVEVAAWFNVTTRTIERRRKNKKFSEVMERGKAKGRLSVRRWQMKLLEQGNATMGVWLGKQLLGQRDQIDYRVEESQVVQLICLPRAGGNRVIDVQPEPVALPETRRILFPSRTYGAVQGELSSTADADPAAKYPSK